MENQLPSITICSRRTFTQSAQRVSAGIKTRGTSLTQPVLSEPRPDIPDDDATDDEFVRYDRKVAWWKDVVQSAYNAEMKTHQVEEAKRVK